MLKFIAAVLTLVLPALVSAQENIPVSRSSSPSGLRIQDTASPLTTSGDAVNSTQGAGGNIGKKESTPDNLQTTNPAKSPVQIQGNTSLKATARNLGAISTGHRSVAGNEVGAIGK